MEASWAVRLQKSEAGADGGKVVLWRWQSFYSQELTALMAAVQDQDRQPSSLDEGRAYERQPYQRS